DTYRPAAYEQLQQIASTIGVPFYGSKGDSDPVTIAVEGINKLINEYRCNIVIIDTAGRHGYGSEERLLEEMKELANAIKPDEVLLVIDAYIGQKAYELARKFHEYTPIGSIIITKIDGTAKGGGALSAVVATGAKIKFVCDGEKLEDIEVFNPKKFVSRLLGLGDLESLLKKFEVLEESKEIEKRVEKMITSGRITLRDVYLQLQSLRKLGPLKKVLEMIPGFSLIPSLTEEQLRLSEDKIKKWISVLDSMTYEELDNPSIIDRRRMRRIAVGSGTTINDVEELLKYYEQLNRLIKELRRKRGLLSKLGVKGLGT
ncbi:MAG: signal recognition particle protein Srp19, partial [Sulfolobales archaeon]